MEGQEEIKTFIFFDLETSGLPRDNPVKITEISLVAAKREHILDVHSGISKENSFNLDYLPRVLNKVSFTVYPSKMIHPMASAVSGLTNDVLEQQKPFDENLCGIIDLYLERLEKPLCFIAHNGYKFDFPILQSELLKIKKKLPDDVFCADTLVGFREVLKNRPEVCSTVQQVDTNDILSDIKPLNPNIQPNHVSKSDWSNEDYDPELLKVAELAEKISTEHDNFNMDEIQSKLNFEVDKIRRMNETTPVRKSISGMNQSQTLTGECHARRKILKEKQPKMQYNLKSLYENLTKKELVNAHRAESDALALLECVTAVGRPILEWADRNRVPFRSIRKLW